MLEIVILLVLFGVLMFAAGMRCATVLHEGRRGGYLEPDVTPTPNRRVRSVL